MKIALSGGGTGGHAYPALSVAEAIRRVAPDANICYIGTSKGPEAALAARSGLPFLGIPGRSLSRKLSWQTPAALGTLALGLAQAYLALRRTRPDTVLATGGYAAAATVLGAALLGIRIVIQEQNTIPGRTNRWLARFAETVCVTFEESRHFFPIAKVVVTGNPLRAALLEPMPTAEARAALGLDPDRLTVLVLGGSQGARAVNEAVCRAVPLWDGRNYQVLHQTGRRQHEHVLQIAPRRDWYHPQPYLEDMRSAYRASDLVVCRSGSTIAEIAAVGLPSVLIPYPFSFADHQTANARVMAGRQAALLVPESELSGERLASGISQILDNAPKRHAMAQAALSIARPHAAEQIARILLKREAAEPDQAVASGDNA